MLSAMRYGFDSISKSYITRVSRFAAQSDALSGSLYRPHSASTMTRQLLTPKWGWLVLKGYSAECRYQTWLEIEGKPVEKPSRSSFAREEGKTNVMNTYHGLPLGMSRVVEGRHVIRAGKQEDPIIYSAS